MCPSLSAPCVKFVKRLSAETVHLKQHSVGTHTQTLDAPNPEMVKKGIFSPVVLLELALSIVGGYNSLSLSLSIYI